jgi:nickel-dependent lactate racemase
MQSTTLKYDLDELTITFPDSQNVQTIKPHPHQISIISTVELDSFVLQNLLIQKRKSVNNISVGIVINDRTRPVPYSILLPPMLSLLLKSGILIENIRFYIANGTHVPESMDKFSHIPQELLKSYQFANHDCDERENLRYLGSTQLGTPVWLNAAFLDCDIKIAVNNIEPHHFAGYSGAAKSVSIGLAARETITYNHQFLTHPHATACEFYLNPIRQDVEEIAKMSQLDLCLSCVMDEQKNIVSVHFGSPESVIQSAIEIVNNLYAVEISSDDQFDLVIASAGGFPKDINLYQAQKALTNAARITKTGGKVLLMAACREGTGSRGYENYISKMIDPQAVLDDFSKQAFVIGPHKALQFAIIQQRVHVALYSKMYPDLVRKLLIEPVEKFENWIKLACQTHLNPRIAILPNAVVTIPILKREVK